MNGDANAGALLQAEAVDVAYGRIEAVRGVSVAVAAGEIVAVLGANGAGKSSLLKSIYGLVAPRAGRLRFNGRQSSCRCRQYIQLGKFNVCFAKF